jgi:riboflavin synthase
MFTGIIEAMGKVEKIEKEGTNRHFLISSPIAGELKIDQSIAHNGVCLTVVDLKPGMYTVTAIEETLKRSNLGDLKEGSLVNLERSMASGGRLDGHIVQGHVDTTAECIQKETLEGSWYYKFRYPAQDKHLMVNKGSICINGVSLTVVEPEEDTFSVAIIPYTFENTNFRTMEAGDKINLEYDILGKYIARYLDQIRDSLPSK